MIFKFIFTGHQIGYKTNNELKTLFSTVIGVLDYQSNDWHRLLLECWLFDLPRVDLFIKRKIPFLS